MIHNLVYYSLLQQKIKKWIFKKPVAITILYNSSLDIDNHGYLAKMIVDALKGYLIQDDNRKYIKKLTQQFWDGKTVRVMDEEI